MLRARSSAAKRSGSSGVVIVDATNVAGEALAEIAVPRRIVSGFHTRWIPDPR